jgi:hypothetical protein
MFDELLQAAANVKTRRDLYQQTHAHWERLLQQQGDYLAIREAQKAAETAERQLHLAEHNLANIVLTALGAQGVV